MERKLQIIISASAASDMAILALAQDTPNPRTGEIANRIARAGNVDNQLEVKSTSTSSN